MEYLEATAADRRRLDKWDRRYLDVAALVSSWSKDPSTKVGAVVVDHLGHIVGTGYNGFPVRVADTDERLNDRPTKYAMVVHAELNAILQAGERARGATIYVYPAFGKPPLCSGCAKAVIQSGIRRAVGYEPEPGNEAAERWAPELAIAAEMCGEAGVRMDMLEQFPCRNDTDGDGDCPACAHGQKDPACRRPG
jgi:dCMP deaminase